MLQNSLLRIPATLGRGHAPSGALGHQAGLAKMKRPIPRNAMTLRSGTVELVYQKDRDMRLTFNIRCREGSRAAAAYVRTPAEMTFSTGPLLHRREVDCAGCDTASTDV